MYKFDSEKMITYVSKSILYLIDKDELEFIVSTYKNYKDQIDKAIKNTDKKIVLF